MKQHVRSPGDKKSWQHISEGFPGSSDGKKSALNAGDLGLIHGLGRSPGEENGYPLQYSGLENSMDLKSMGSQRTGHDCATFMHFPGGSAGKESACNARDLGSIPGLGRSPGEENGYPLQYSGLDNSMDYTVYADL